MVSADVNIKAGPFHNIYYYITVDFLHVVKQELKLMGDFIFNHFTRIVFL